LEVRPIDRNQSVVDSAYRPLQNLLVFSNQVKKAIDYLTTPDLIVTSLDDLPRPFGGVITIPAGVCVNIHGAVDLQGNRIVFAGIGVIKGSNAETASITSSLSSGAMIYSESLLQLRDITLSTGSGAYCVEIDGTADPTAVADWIGVNFTGGKAAKLTTLGNVISILMVLLSPDNGIEFFGTFGTIAFSETIFSLSGASKTVVYSTDGVFGNNKYLNTTGQTPTYQYIGTTRIVQPEIKLGEDLNTLNDWKSAKSWTPTLGTTGTQPTTVTYNSNTGATYSKVGDIVFIQGQLRTSAVTVGPATGSIVINGLPFPAVANTGSTLDGWGSISIGQSASWSKAPLSGIIYSGESRIRLQTRATFAGDTTDTVVSDLIAGAGNIVFFSGWYKTTAT